MHIGHNTYTRVHNASGVLYSYRFFVAVFYGLEVLVNRRPIVEIVESTWPK